jgi:hypothetical protein
MRICMVACALVGLMAGCGKKAGGGGSSVSSGSGSAEKAFLRLEKAIAAGDAPGFYQMLDGPTQAAIEATLKDQKLQRTIITAKYPEAEAQRALLTLRAAEADDAAAYFKRINDERHVVEAFRKRLGAVSGPIKSKIDGPDAVWVARQMDGMPFHFAKSRDGTWGFSELRGDWELEKDRAAHGVKTVRDNAKLYQKTEGQ